MEYGHREPPPKFQFLESCVRNGISRASIQQESKTLHKEGSGADADGPTWIDPNENILFAVSAILGADDILHIAESVSLVKTEK